jgi:deazaflavin-dependent oxidoreductase (nitroreductase family)
MKLNDLPFVAMSVLHRAIYRLSGGRVLGDTMGMKVIELETTGAKSGKPRTVMLTVPVTYQGRDVVVASKGGVPDHPSWYYNLKKNPDVKVTVKGKTQPARARIATADERAELWPQVTSRYKGYAGYQKKTERTIPLVILEAA